jgi:cytochrome c oxidase subunit 1
MVVFTMAMTFAGTFGAPRRHWDITFAQAPFDVEYHPAVNIMLGFVALGGLTAAFSVFSYILITVWSVFFGKPYTSGEPAHADVRNPFRPGDAAPALAGR